MFASQHHQFSNGPISAAGPATTTGAKTIKIMLPGDHYAQTIAERALVTPNMVSSVGAQGGLASNLNTGAPLAAATSNNTEPHQANQRQGSAKSGFAEKRVSVYANMAQKKQVQAGTNPTSPLPKGAEEKKDAPPQQNKVVTPIIKKVVINTPGGGLKNSAKTPNRTKNEFDEASCSEEQNHHEKAD